MTAAAAVPQVGRDVEALDADDGREIMALLIQELRRRLNEEPVKLKAADFEMIRKLLADNGVTFASVRRGDYGDFAKSAADEFNVPFPEGDGSETFN